MAMNKVFSIMQMVMPKSTKGSITKKCTAFLILIHGVQQSHFRKMSANLYQQGGHGLSINSKSENMISWFKYNITILFHCKQLQAFDWVLLSTHKYTVYNLAVAYSVESIESLNTSPCRAWLAELTALPFLLGRPDSSIKSILPFDLDTLINIRN